MACSLKVYQFLPHFSLIQRPQTLNKDQFFLAVVGSSAGGLDALSELFASFSKEPENVAFIVAQHLSPDFKSHLTELLTRESKLPVQQAKDGQPIKPGMVYVTPPEKNISVTHGKISLEKSTTMYKPSIDLLFKSAADCYGTNCIGIILSGTGSDGAQGIVDIKKRGGLTLVQNPKNADYDGMPVAAINTKHVDLTLQVNEMPSVVEYYACYKKIKRNFKAAEKYGNSPEEKVLKHLEQYSGTDFTSYKTSTITRRMESRITQLNLKSAEQYFAYIKKHPDELGILYKHFLIGVTSFFRDKDSFRFLKRKLAEIIVAKIDKAPVRVWVPGCATGEEAYTIAIILHEILGEKIKERHVQIFASDIDENALMTGRKGLFEADSLAHVDKSLLEKYFTKIGNRYEVAKFIRTMVLFNKHDLTTHPPFVKLDLISCRNLLIYFKHKLQDQVIPVFHYSLKEGGLLFLGKSESIGHHKDLFTTINTSHKVYMKKPAIIQRRPTIKIKNIKLIKEPVPHSSQLLLEELLREEFYTSYEHPYVVVNENLDVVHLQGNLSPYLGLQQGAMTMNVIKIAHKELQVELRAVLNKSMNENKKQAGYVKCLRVGKKETYLRILAWPLRKKNNQRNLFIVAFEKIDHVELPYLVGVKPKKATSKENVRIVELEKELHQTKEHLQSFIEELETSNEELQTLNEELQSTNEELQAANEELETSNEEMQSTNQEMVIAYNELRELHRVLEEKETALRIVNNKFQTVLDHAKQCYMLVDENYTIVSFNREAIRFSKFFNEKLLSEGESIFNFLPNNLVSEFKRNFDSAIKGNTVTHEQSISTPKEEMWLRFSYAPVYGVKDRVDNVLISYIDLTPEMKAHKKVEASEMLFRSLIENSGDVIMRLDEDGNILYTSPSAKRILGYPQQEQTGHSFAKFLVEEDIPVALHEFNTAIRNPGKPVTSNFRIKHKEGRTIWMESTLVNMLNLSEVQSVIVNMRDITSKKEAEEKLQGSEEFYRALITNSSDVVQLQDEEGIIKYESPSVKNVLGYQPIDMIGRRTADFIHPEDLSQAGELIQKVITGELGELLTQLRVLHKDGHYIWVEARVMNMLHNPPVKAIVINYRDITGQKLAVAALEKSEANLLTIFNNTDVGYILLDDKLTIVAFNPRIHELLSLTYGQKMTLGDNFISYFENKTYPSAKQMMRRVQAGENTRFETSRSLPDGSQKWFNVRINRILNNENQTLGLCIAIADITASKQAEFESEKMTFDLLQRNKDLEQFGYIVSHNLRAPVANLLGIANIIGDPKLSNVEKETLFAGITHSLKKLDTIINDLNAVLQIRRGLSEKKETVYFQELIHDIRGSIQSLIVNEQVEIRTDFSAIDKILTLKSYLHSILYNLLTNSIKYRKPEVTPIIEIKSECNEHQIILLYKDNGLGIDLETYGNYVFGLYKRFHLHKEGKGMGLFMVKSQVEALGGKISIRSEVDKGTEFKIEFGA